MKASAFGDGERTEKGFRTHKKQEASEMTDELNSGLTQRIGEGFAEIDSAIVAALPKTDERYAELKAKENELKSRFPQIEKWLEGKDPLTLSAEEHSALTEYLELNAEMEGIERLAIYYAGHKDCFAYLKKIGAI